jgi:hypothetical protein
MGSRGILMGRSMGHGEVRSLILRALKIRGELEVSRIQWTLRGSVGRLRQYRFFW